METEASKPHASPYFVIVGNPLLSERDGNGEA